VNVVSHFVIKFFQKGVNIGRPNYCARDDEILDITEDDVDIKDWTMTTWLTTPVLESPSRLATTKIAVHLRLNRDWGKALVRRAMVSAFFVFLKRQYYRPKSRQSSCFSGCYGHKKNRAVIRILSFFLRHAANIKKLEITYLVSGYSY